VLSLKHQTYIEAVRSIGASDFTIMLRHLLPGTISSVVVYLTMRIGTSIITAASLSFLGLGAQPPTPEWGAMLNEARADMLNAPHIALFPSLAIFFTVLAFNLLGDGLRDALDPKLDSTDGACPALGAPAHRRLPSGALDAITDVPGVSSAIARSTRASCRPA
jgi:glutathione transport system permease protein